MFGAIASLCLFAFLPEFFLPQKRYAGSVQLSVRFEKS